MRLLWIFFLMCWMANSQAFNSQNHSVICQMAYEQLSLEVQQKIESLIVKSPFKSFAEGCSWPDKIRSQAIFKHTKPWHYINVPRTATEVKQEDCGNKGCILSAITLMQQRLKNNPDNDWQALLFLSHFVGDIHQPLHVSFADDLGGNTTTIKVRKRSTNMHTLWDGALLKRQKWTDRSQRLLKEITPQQKQQWQTDNVLVWASESLQLTGDAYRLLPPSKKVDDKYLEFFAPKLEEQMQKASVRLALLLDQNLSL